MFGSGRKSDDTLDSPELTISLEPELVKEKDIRSMTHGGDKSHVGEKPSHHFPAAKELVSPPAKVLPKGTVTTSVPSNPVLNPTAPSVDESEYVSRREYNELLKTVEELSKRIALLELKL
uniref:Uncharacterized protein n=1 Tax=Steinernema glaseri TaxID=37863 RepID=A0A1I8A4W5_9BILA